VPGSTVGRRRVWRSGWHDGGDHRLASR
jgi:hypothetical protein